MVEAINYHLMHPTSIVDVYKVCEHHNMPWTGIWMLPYIAISVQVEAKFGNIRLRVEVLDVEYNYDAKLMSWLGPVSHC